MTIRADRTNREPISACVALVVMPMFGLVATVFAFERVCGREFTRSYCRIHCLARSMLKGIFPLVRQVAQTPFCFMTLCLLVTSSCGFAGLSFLVFSPAVIHAIFAPATSPIISAFVLGKLRQRFSGLAFRASFGYDFLSHILTSIKSMLEPSAGYIPALGSHYYTKPQVVCNVNSRVVPGQPAGAEILIFEIEGA